MYYINCKHIYFLFALKPILIIKILFFTYYPYCLSSLHKLPIVVKYNLT